MFQRMKLTGLIIFMLILVLINTGCRIFQAAGNRNQAGQAATATPTGLALPPNSEQKISGVVIENIQDCVVDGLCLLRLQVAGQPVTVIYHYGEWPPCANEPAIKQGFALAKGDRVEVFGQVTAQGELSTCDASSYYIQTLP